MEPAEREFKERPVAGGTGGGITEGTDGSHLGDLEEVAPGSPGNQGWMV